MTDAPGVGVRSLDKDLSNRNMDPHMANVISEYISRFIAPYKGLSVASMVEEAFDYGGLFVARDGVLGLKPFNANTWEVLFFVAESQGTRKSLIQKAAETLGRISINFTRWKHNDRTRTYGPRLWERLAA
ncbi:MAG: hypothetical protein EBU96_04220 [Actinobacteria bacterium]|nr:hypothetical protein [Actinomycetota bacterium]